MRGKEKRIISFTFDLRITPAYAGKRPVVAAVLNRVRDHPRLCGEKFVKSFKHVRTPGSPPPMRGKALMPESFVNQARITPAYAGKRIHHDRLNAVIRDHPRLCGEKCILCKYTKVFQGSPPPMRGKASSSSNSRNSAGITPAYAGKSKIVQHFGVTTEDHPRLCGEKFTSWQTTAFPRGSPPPMRGKVYHGYGKEQSQRITPAYAGKSDLLVVQPCTENRITPAYAGKRPDLCP